jgi:hypothetical protein
MLNMMWEFGFAPALDCLAQTWQTESGSKRGAETRFVYKVQRRSFAAYPARRKPSEMVVTMGFERITGYQRRTRRARSQRPADSAADRFFSDAAHCRTDFVTARGRKQSLQLYRNYLGLPHCAINVSSYAAA